MPLITWTHKGDAKKGYADTVTVDAEEIERNLYNMTPEDRYEFIMGDHTNAFKDRKGNSIKEILLDKSFEILLNNPNIPPQVRAYWSRIPVAQRGKKLAEFQDAMHKVEISLMDMMTLAIAKAKTPEETKKLMQEVVIPTMRAAYDNVCKVITDGQYAANENLGNLLLNTVRTQSATVDPNSDAFAFYKDIMVSWDPKTNIQISC